MTKLPVISGREALMALKRAGWIEARQTGSHIVMVKSGSTVSVSVPDHKELDRGTLKGIIRLAGLTVDEFASLLKR